MIAQKAQHMPGNPDKVRVLQRKLYVAAKKADISREVQATAKSHRVSLRNRASIVCTIESSDGLCMRPHESYRKAV